MTTNSTQRINTAIDSLGEDYPELASELEQIESIEEDDTYQTIGLTQEDVLLVSPDFIDRMSDAELVGAMAQVALRYQNNMFDRAPEGQYNHRAWNVAQDLKINYILIHDMGFSMNGDSLLPDEDGTFVEDSMDIRVEGVGEKTVEEIYEEIDSQMIVESEPVELEGDLDDLE